MKSRFMFVLVGLLVAGFAFSAGQQEEQTKAASMEPQTVWIWGWPEWMGGTLEPEQMPNASEWARDKFGMDIRYTSKPQGVDVIQGLNLLLAEGEFPDVILFGSYSVPIKILIDGLVEEGKLLSLQKYYDNPSRYPELAQADKDYLMAYMVNGEIYAHPTFGWHVKKSDPREVSWGWVTRIDVAKAFGMTGVSGHPKNADEMYQLLKKIKTSEIKDWGGGALSAAFSFNPDAELATLRALVSQLKGAGWQVDKQSRYGPDWASQEYYNSLKELNKWWNEGLVYEGQFTIKPNDWWEMTGAKREFGVWFGSRGVVKAVPPGTPMKNDAGNFNQAYLDRLNFESGFIDPPIQEGPNKLGKLTVGLAGPAVVSADCANPDAYMKLIDWLLSKEGIITTGYWAGRMGVEWEFVEGKPYSWQAIGKDPGSHERPPWISDMWPNPDTVGETGGNIFTLPFLRYLAEPPYTSFTHQIMQGGTDKGTIGEFEWISMIPLSFVREPADPRWATRYARFVSPIPSYDLFTKVLTPAESAAMATTEQRLLEQLPRVVTAADFNAAYNTFIRTLNSITNWKALYTKLQSQWEAWMELNGDDTAKLQTIEWRPEWTATMGW